MHTAADTEKLKLRLERARRHVAEAENRISEQRELLERLADREEWKRTAEALLRSYEQTLDTMQWHLALEEMDERGWTWERIATRWSDPHI